jgi:surface antigen
MGRRFGAWLRLLAGGCLMLGLAACGGGGYARYGQSTPYTCVPYARQVSGLRLSGDAWQWWGAARGRYAQASRPETGGVLVFSRTGRLPQGHLAVVSAVSSPRRILVTQANWLPYRITSNQPVLDVSPGNDWSAVRVWWPPASGWGMTVYPTKGFILPQPPGASPQPVYGETAPMVMETRPPAAQQARLAALP